MKLSESYKKRLCELAGTKVLAESSPSSVVKDELNALPFKKDIEGLGGKIYAVGGAVRDEILGKSSKDLDILITGIPLDRLEHILINYGKVKEVGKSFGIIKFVPFGETEDMDIAIPRTEKLIGAGHKGFEVASDHTLPIEADLARRDFRFNSIAKDAEGNIIDPFGGVEDLKNKIIRATNEKTFEDDALRLLRSIQFASRFGFTIERNTMAMIKKNAYKIKEIPAERYLIEFDKIIKKGDVKSGVDLLVETGLFKEIFGFNYAGTNDFSKVKTMADFIYKAFENSGNIASSFYRNNLKGEINITNQIKGLELQKQLIGDKVGDRKTVQKIMNLSLDIEQTGMLNDNTKDIIKTFKDGSYPLKTTDLKINGDDLKSMGYQKEEIGKRLAVIMNAVLSDEIPNKKEEIVKLIQELDKPTELDKNDELNLSDNPGSINSISEIRNIVRNIIAESMFEKTPEYKKWKIKNVTLRGISKNTNEFNGAGARFGDGLYTASLSNKAMAKEYGNIYYVVNARPKHPVVFNDTNRAEIWLQQNVYFKNYKDVREFNKNTTIKDEVLKFGYDGIEVKGREMVNYTPEDVKYFKTEDELIEYYEKFVK